MVSTEGLEQFMARGAVWLVLAAIWAAACVWVERDAPRVFRKAGLFRIFFVVLGTLLFLTTCQFGLRSLAVMLPLLPLALVSYGVMREISAPPECQLLPRQFGGILQKAAQVLPIGRLLDKLRAPGGGGFGSTAAGSAEIALLKKNGQPYDGKDVHGLDQETSRAIRSVQGILLTAIQMRATDVHMDPKVGDELQIRYRVDGILQTISTLPGAAGRAIVSAGKVLADMDIAERRRPQDGTFAA
ncbi:MAG: ATPase, T2SS/T4P/T4SS family, partial [Planctomycetota bacterium]